MAGKGKVTLGLLAAGALVVAARRLRRAAHVEQRGDGWHVVTVLRAPHELSGPDRPGVLAELAEHYRVRVTPAPGERGSEVAVWPADRQARERLRAVKQILEIGEVLRIAGQPEGVRTWLGKAAVPVARRLARRGA